MATVAGLAGCSDPFSRPGTWDVTGANEVNRAAQVADWRDLVAGHGDPGSDGLEAAAAVDRLRRGVVKPLPTATVSDIAASGSAVPQSAAAGTTAAVAN